VLLNLWLQHYFWHLWHLWHLAFVIWHLVSLLHDAGVSTVADFSTNSGGPAAVDISAAVIPDVNGIPAVAGLPACCCWPHYL
jgi:hypothetical protein